MTTQSDPNQEDGAASRIDLLKVIRDYQRVILRATVTVSVVAAVLGAWYLFWGQTVRTTVSQQFRPVFNGANVGQYPNGLAFGPSDITAEPIIDQVFDKNSIGDYCPRDVFRSAFFVEEQSAEYAFLDAEYQGRLADARLTAVERDRLQAEYRVKRTALPLEHRVVFIKPSSCGKIPPVVMSKAITDILSTWAEDAELKRGVLKLNVQVLTPGTLDIGNSGQVSQLIRTDLVRAALRRLADNIGMVEDLPGAGLIRMGEKRETFSEVKTKVEDLLQARLEPLVIGAGKGLGRDSIAWAAEALASAARSQKVAEGNAKAYLDALREYSGTPQPSSAARPESRQSPTGSSDAQALTPLIDRTFVDRIVELSAPNMVFRQELTRSLVLANVEAVRQEANVSHYQRLVDQLRQPGVSDLSPQEIDQRLKAIQDDGKVLAKQFNDLYDEFSRVSLRASASMYKLEGPVQMDVARAFTLRSYILVVAGAFFVTLLLAVGGCIVWSRVNSTFITAD